MALDAIEKEVTAALHRISKKNPEIRKRLDKAHGYAVFPSVGRASLVLGGTYGRGQLYEHGEPVGFATMGQVTLGVQVGGDTFDELVVFNSREALDRFKRGRYAFTANASAVIVRAAASGTIDFEKDVVSKAFGRGGMLLEISLGAQKFSFDTPQAKALAVTAEDEKRARDEREPRVELPAEGQAAEGQAAEAQAAEAQAGEGAGEAQAGEGAAAPPSEEGARAAEAEARETAKSHEAAAEAEPEEEAEAKPSRRIGRRTRAVASRILGVPSRLAHRYRNHHP